MLAFIRRACITLVIMSFLCFVWRQLEMNMYGAVQYREVDDIVLMFIAPFVYVTVAYFER